MDIERILQPIDLQSAGAKVDVVNAARKTGFIVIKNHGLELKLIHKVLDAFHEFYHLPEEIKTKYIVRNKTCGLGFFDMESENASGEKVKNYMEYFHWGMGNVILVELPEGSSIAEMNSMSRGDIIAILTQNGELKVEFSDLTKEQILSSLEKNELKLPVKLPFEELDNTSVVLENGQEISISFEHKITREDMIRLFGNYENISQQLLDMLEDGLQEESSEIVEVIKINNAKFISQDDGRCLRNMIGGGTTISRVIHYPPIPEDKKGAPGAKAHTDMNLLTLLGGATAKGLQIKPLGSKEWVTVPTDKDWLVINIGDTLEFMTGGFYPSTEHRVVRDGSLENICRLSMPFFGNSKPDVMLSPLFGPIRGDKMSPTMARDLQLKRLHDIGEPVPIEEEQVIWKLEERRSNIRDLSDAILSLHKMGKDENIDPAEIITKVSLDGEHHSYEELALEYINRCRVA